MKNDILKGWRELDFDKVDFSGGKWTWGCGGHGLKNTDFHIDHIADDGSATIYPIPACIGEIIRKQEELGKRDAQASMRSALGM